MWRELSGKAMAVCSLALAVGTLAACESTQSESARLGREGKTALNQKGVAVAHRSKDFEVISTTVLQDSNGAAAVVELRNTSRKALTAAPISIDVLGRNGSSVFRNNAPGLEPTLAHVPVVPAGKRFTWVNDQVSPTARAGSIRAVVGAGRAVDGNHLPAVSVQGARLESDPVSGVAATGFAANRSNVDQRKLVITAVARRGSRVVAAGRGQIPRLKPGKRARFQIFFIGDPRGASLDLEAPASTLGRGA